MNVYRDQVMAVGKEEGSLFEVGVDGRQHFVLYLLGIRVK